jgi:pyruvate/2-oxoglutarate dehydrogenase complex dihydrolipoamide acyltransferase (E2) component
MDKPWVVEGEIAVRKVTELTLTVDHRVCDGGTAAEGSSVTLPIVWKTRDRS